MRRLLPIFAPVAVLAGLAAATPASASTAIAPARAFAPRQLVVKFDGQAVGRAMGLPAGVDVLTAAAAMRRNPRVAYAEPNYIATASSAPGDPAFALPNDPGTLGGASEASASPGDWAFKQWNFLPWEGTATSQLPISPGGIDAVAAWQHLAEFGDPGAAGKTVAVLDTGIAYRPLGPKFQRSPDFGADQFVPGYDFVDHDGFPVDENGHGTHVAGTIAENTDNAIGLTGLAYGAKLMPVRVLDAHGRGSALEIAKGIRFAVLHHANVINMSFNFDCGKKVPMVDEALRLAYDKGVVAVASAGNLGSETCVSEPATGPRVIAVGGTTEGGCLGNYSLSGPIDLVAPGGGEPASGCPSVLARPIYQVTLEAGTTSTFAIPSDYVGTSMAAAHVSGLAAMVLATGLTGDGGLHHRGKPLLRHIVNAVTGRLRKTARDLGLPLTQQGAGLIDAGRATEKPVFLR
jgi:serine protease